MNYAQCLYEIILGAIAEIRPIFFLPYMRSAKYKTSASSRFMEKSRGILILLSARRATNQMASLLTVSSIMIKNGPANVKNLAMQTK